MADKMKKFFGDDSGLWYCKLEKCLYMFDTKEIKNMDSEGKLSWCRPNKTKDTILPMCPHHGLELTYSPDNKTVKQVAEGVSVILH